MRRNWRGRFRNNWYRGRNNQNNRSDSLNNSTSTHLLSSTAGSSRAPANQLPTILPISIHDNNNIWKLYFPTEGN